MTEPCPTTPRSDRVVIVVDSREQEPYVFDPERVTIVRRALPAGDYSLDGHETAIAAERKSIDDYVASVVRGRDRFARELRVLSGYDVACVVVEATLEDILAHRYRSDAHPNAVLGATLSIIVDRSVPVFFCGDRQIAQRFVEGLLCRYHRKVVGA
jgi:DNA excision repair protein ERCC-4